MTKKTKTSGFGAGKREGHDSSAFYRNQIYQDMDQGNCQTPTSQATNITDLEAWSDRIYCQTSEKMPLPDNCIALALTSPPYNTNKNYEEYQDNLTLSDYLDLIHRVGQEIYRILLPGGRYMINIANLGRKPYIPMTSHFYRVHMDIGFRPVGEIIWRKAKGASGNCAWGSWMSAKSPFLRDIHEYILVFTKGGFARLDKGISDITRNEFLEATLSIWEIPPESARRVGHPAPFPIELAARAIKLFSYKGDVILDPFNGVGTTCVAAKRLGRHYVGFDISEKYCQIAENRLAEVDR